MMGRFLLLADALQVGRAIPHMPFRHRGELADRVFYDLDGCFFQSGTSVGNGFLILRQARMLANGTLSALVLEDMWGLRDLHDG